MGGIDFKIGFVSTSKISEGKRKTSGNPFKSTDYSHVYETA
jgi:hypothetical protein